MTQRLCDDQSLTVTKTGSTYAVRMNLKQVSGLFTMTLWIGNLFKVKL